MIRYSRGSWTALLITGLGASASGSVAWAGPAASASSASSALQPSPPSAVLNREEFETSLRTALPQLQGCYESAIKKDAIAEGTVVLLIQTRGGKVVVADTDPDRSSLKIRDRKVLQEMQKCISTAIRATKMPLAKVDGKHDPKATAVIHYPVEFSLGIDVVSGVERTSGAKLDPDAVKRSFEVHKFTIGKCYLDARKAMRSASGKIMLKIGATGGKVTSVEETPETNVEDTTFRACVLDVVRGLSLPVAKDAKGLPDPGASSVIYYPLQFR